MNKLGSGTFLSNEAVMLSNTEGYVGKYVEYKGIVHVITKYDEYRDKVMLLNPLGSHRKYNVKSENVKFLNTGAKKVRFKCDEYLVTRTHMIISLKTGRIILSHNIRREAILAAIGE